MLGQRIATAIVLLIVLGLAMSLATPWPFLALLALATGCAGWEWLRLTLPGTARRAGAEGAGGAGARDANYGAVLGGVLLALISLALAFLWLQTPTAEPSLRSLGVMFRFVVPLAVILWIVVAIPTVVRGRADAAPGSIGLSLFAVPALLAAWAVLAILFVQRGPWFVLSLLAVVWVADIAAYFTGRAFGRRKLAPRVSPGKTIEGALGGVLAVLVWIAVSSLWAPSFGAALVARWGWGGALPLAAVLAALSIIGDLFESLLKRRAGRKDSSALLPGHGGVYDRIDAVLPVAPLAFILIGVWS
ncbi:MULTISPECIES: phosphatidate cytidylyltransferase [unclassified Achromobacter]|uniref:phosphatidate cytidylyltransferase n=1 Tax=unclassified Achromobacter TaxID=2626865 RepID=UPI000B514CE6|nr:MULTISPECIES: phosphatidate cytidylyltransferase [unclassified Achromobacter]OWT80002.1 phosphatidate cytidylyltransferase [Achromobacter sp. HZ34]OWT81886.1 phosphatidate cytidylyltransferase [Achromobacter sp. HZ28]